MLIAVPFLLCRLAGADDAYAILVTGVGIAMDDDQHDNRSHQAQCMPSLFGALDAVRDNDMKRVVPNLLGQLE
ncbi:hypothetical protein ASE77_17415 [Sphingomonas sp. Leaf226]|nr:hypothetical protein ASE77_17415 [Sphingomonas sp. Leaf226]